MKFKFAAVALLASATLFCSESFGTDLLGRVLGRGGCGCGVSSCEPDCGCEAAPVVEDCGCTEVAEDCGCGSRSGLLSRLGSRERRGVLCGCGPTCPAPAPEPCCEPAPVVEDCGCEAAPECADPCEKRVGLLNKLRARCKGRSCGASADCGCEAAPEPVADCGCEAAPEPVADCGCEAEPACADPCEKRVGLLNKLMSRCKGRSCGAAADCGCEAAPAPVADCGCEAAPAPVADCGCEAAPEPAADCGCEAAPACADPCEKRVGLLNKLMSRCKGRSCGAAADCGCEAAPAADCGCEAAPAADCGCEAAPAPACEPAPVVADCGCEAEPSCGCDAAPRCGGQIRSRLAARPKLRSGCGCDAPAATCGGGCDSGFDNGCESLTLLDRLRGNRLPRDRCGKVRCGCPNDGCNSPCPGGCDSAPMESAPVTSGCSSCGGGEVIYGQPVSGDSVMPMQESAPAEGVVVPSVNETQGEIVPGDSASKAPVVRPDAFVIRDAR